LMSGEDGGQIGCSEKFWTFSKTSLSLFLFEPASG
jgi:hypothetical protein